MINTVSLNLSSSDQFLPLHPSYVLYLLYTFPCLYYLFFTLPIQFPILFYPTCPALEVPTLLCLCSVPVVFSVWFAHNSLEHGPVEFTLFICSANELLKTVFCRGCYAFLVNGSSTCPCHPSTQHICLMSTLLKLNPSLWSL